MPNLELGVKYAQKITESSLLKFYEAMVQGFLGQTAPQLDG